MILVGVGAAALVHPSLPERFAVRFDASGTPDSLYGKHLGVRDRPGTTTVEPATEAKA